MPNVTAKTIELGRNAFSGESNLLTFLSANKAICKKYKIGPIAVKSTSNKEVTGSTLSYCLMCICFHY